MPPDLHARPPVVGITTYGRDEAGRFALPAAYVDAVRAAGGVPVLLPPGERDPAAVLALVDALILAGGGDIDPARYGGCHHPTVYMVDPERDTFELELARQVLASPLPLLAICRGTQVVNVAGGGDLVVHVPEGYGTAILHRTEEPRAPVDHPVAVVPEARLAAILGQTEIPVRSWHHQALRRIAPGWRVVARAPDGVVEALEHEAHPWAVAVQWHPELSADAPFHRRLFRALVDAAAR